MSQIEIRKANVSDFEQVYSLIMEFAEFIKTPEKVKITPSQMSEDQDFFNCVIAIDGERIIGFASYFFAYYSWTGKSIYLDDLFVSNEYRGAGIGTRLFDVVAEIGRENSCRKMRWQVSNWNEKAIEFYRAKGAGIDAVEINCDLSL